MEFTIREIRKYLYNCESLEEAIENLNDENICKVNNIETTKDCEFYYHNQCGCNNRCSYLKK